MVSIAPIIKITIPAFFISSVLVKLILVQILSLHGWIHVPEYFGILSDLWINMIFTFIFQQISHHHGICLELPQLNVVISLANKGTLHLVK